MTPAALSALGKGDMENFIAASTPGGIEAQEKAGQIEQSFLETLPKEGFDGNGNALEALGFKKIGDHDDLFYKVRFPAGWRKRATDHSMWSELLDDRGRVRGMIFYKAAFYDRRAHCGLVTRYDVRGDYEVKPTGYIAVDGDKELYRTTTGYDTAKAWLSKHYPNWRNPLAYWD